MLFELEKKMDKNTKCKQQYTLWLTFYYVTNYNSSIIVIWIRGKDGLIIKNVNNNTHYNLLTIVLQK